jgi:tape measure domain-containing protein
VAEIDFNIRVNNSGGQGLSAFESALKQIAGVTDHLDAQLHGLADIAEILDRGFGDVTRSLDRTGRELGDTDKAARKTADGFGILKSRTADYVKGLIVHDALRLTKDAVQEFGRSFYDVNDRAETFMVTLNTLYHSLDKAERKYAEFVRFSQKTPFNFKDVGDMAIRLKAYQLEPTTKLMTTIGDTVAAFGGDRNIMSGVVRALGQIKTKGEAAGQELRQLAEWGVPAYEILQQKLGLTAEQVQNIGKYSVSSEKVLNALLEGLDERFGGQMDKLIDKAKGITGELGDRWEQFMKLVGDSGSWDEVLRALGEIREEVNEAFESGAAEEWAKRVSGTLSDVIATAENLTPLMLSLLGIATRAAELAAGAARVATEAIPNSEHHGERFHGLGLADSYRSYIDQRDRPREAVDSLTDLFTRDHTQVPFKPGFVPALDETASAAGRVKQAAEDAYAALRKLVEGSEATGPATMTAEQSGVYAVFPDFPKTAEEIEREYRALRERMNNIMRTGGAEGEWAQEQIRQIREAAASLKGDAAAAGMPHLAMQDMVSDFLTVEKAIAEITAVTNLPHSFTFDVSQPITELEKVRQAIESIPRVLPIEVQLSVGNDGALRKAMMGGTPINSGASGVWNSSEGGQIMEQFDNYLASRILTDRSPTGRTIKEITKKNAYVRKSGD